MDLGPFPFSKVSIQCHKFPSKHCFRCILQILICCILLFIQFNVFFINVFIYLLIYLFLAALGLYCCPRAFSSCGEQGLLFVAVCGLLIAVASLVAEHRLQACRLQELWLVGSRAQAQQLWFMGLVAPWHVGSSQTRAQTRVSCIGRRILNHCATREVQFNVFVNFF